VIESNARTAGAVDVVVVGAGQCGLAVSRLLAERGIRHVVLERGEVANAWRERRWKSLRLLTPNRMTRLPGYVYAGNDPDGFMRVPELVEFLEDYAAQSRAPVVTHADVRSVRHEGGRYRVVSSRGVWFASAVVLANGASAAPVVPAFARDLPAGITQRTALDYQGPDELADGGALVVGASASGLQFAEELSRTGRDVLLAVGEHVRLPRHYRGHDILDWMAECGILDEPYDEIDDLVRGRNLPSPQLVGDRKRPILDLNSLTDRGVRITGRLMGVRDGVAQFSGSLANLCALADLKMRRLLATIDLYIDGQSGDAGLPPAKRFADTRVPARSLLRLDLAKAGVRNVIWATGFRPDYRWLHVPVFDPKGRLKHDGGVLEAPGLYAMGLPLMRRRKSSYIFGVEDDARNITRHLAGYLSTSVTVRTSGKVRDHERRMYGDFAGAGGAGA
jgi:putative flavoprotein involved in K+ transport